MAYVYLNGEKTYISFQGVRYYLRKSDYTLNVSPLHISDDMSGKLAGIPSISTSCRVNPHCLARMRAGKAGAICKSCFAEKTLSRYSDTDRAAESNFILLNSGLLPDAWLPVFGNVRYVRIESFGDLYTVNQARNYLRIVKKNPGVIFAWWTKNAGILARAIKLEGRPKNLSLVQSSELIDKPDKKRFPFFDHVFTVYSSEKTAADHGKKITCGARSCMGCLRCYSRRTACDVSELLK